MSYLYAGKILKVNLTTGKVSIEPTERYIDSYLGGKGIGIGMLLDNVPSGTDPFSEGNTISFDTGPFTGTMMPGSGRCHVTGKSPLTGLLGVSNFGGHFAPELKYAGYDHLVVSGSSSHPVYIHIDNDTVQIKDASHIWGKNAYETQDLIRKELREPDVKCACIGQAGERLVRFATVQSSVGDAAGRTGLGAVMGSKKLKAVAVRGTRGLKVANPTKFYELCEWCYGLLKATDGYQIYSTIGTSQDLDYQTRAGFIPVKNYTEAGDVWYGDDVSGERFFKDKGHAKTGCFNCPMRCMDQYRIAGLGNSVVSCQPYIELEQKIGLRDRMVWFELLLLIQKYGYDSQSLGAMMAWAIELFQRGIIDENDTGGMPLMWDDKNTYLFLAEAIANREGIGDILAEGPVRAAKRIGRGSERFAVHTKGLPQFATDNRSFHAMALGTAVGPRGDVVRGTVGAEVGTAIASTMIKSGEDKAEWQAVLDYYQKNIVPKITGTGKAADPLEYAGKADLCAFYEDTTGVGDIVMNCKWHTEWCDMPSQPDVQAKVLSAGTGRDYTAEDLFNYQRKIRHMERFFDCREGLTREQDTNPARVFEDPLKEGIFKGVVLDRDQFERMKDRYYRLRGWDVQTGIPTRETLELCGLRDLAGQLDELAALSIGEPGQADK